jgi:uncharacterized membrane protein YfcA
VILAGEWRHIQRQTVAWLVPPALIGIAGGFAVLRSADETSIKLLASAVVVAFAVLLLAGFRLPRVDSRWATWVTGLTSGVLSTSTGLSGPPVVVLFTARGLTPTTFRVTLTAYFACVDLVTLGLLAGSRSIGRDDAVLAVALVPAALVGRAAGRWLATRTSPERFRRLSLSLLALTGISGLVSAAIAIA